MCVYSVYMFALVLPGLYNLILAGWAYPGWSSPVCWLMRGLSGWLCQDTWAGGRAPAPKPWMKREWALSRKNPFEWASGQMRLWLERRRAFPQTQTRDFQDAEFHSAFSPLRHLHMWTWLLTCRSRVHTQQLIIIMGCLTLRASWVA